MDHKRDDVAEKHVPVGEDGQYDIQAGDNVLKKSLKGRHMQMIAIGGAIGAGLFVGSASAFHQGGPGAVLFGWLIIGVMVYLMMQALAELAVMYPVNGAFTLHIIRFVDPSWGFACGWQYAISWLILVAFEISAACNIIHFWPGSLGINDAAWIVPLLVALAVIQVFGVRGYGEVEMTLSLIKIVAVVGFILFAIIDNCGGVPTDPRGYIGAKNWHLPSPNKAFQNGFHGFCSVFVTAAFSYNGAELTGLAAAEAEDPVKEIPRATNQTIWRIAIFYILSLFLIGLNVPANDDLYNGNGPSSRYSPFVIAFEKAGVKVLPSIFNAVVLIAVLSVANSSSYGSTRTVQALCAEGMGPKFFAYIDKRGRPVVVIVAQLLLGCLAFINLASNGSDIFNWLLSLSGITSLFVYGSIALAHIRFRNAWKANGHTLDELPYKAVFGVWGSYLCVFICVISLIAQFYVALYPIGGPYLSANLFFQLYLAAPFLVALYLGWKIYSWFYVPSHRPFFISLKDIDIYTGLRESQRRISAPDVSYEERQGALAERAEKKNSGALGWMTSAVRNIF